MIFSQSWGSISWRLRERHNDLPFLPKGMKIERAEKLVAHFHNKIEYVIHIWNLKKASNHRSVLKKVYRVFKLNQNAWLKPYIDMNTDLRKKAKDDFEKNSFKFLVKLWKRWDSIEILNLLQQQK